jgi:hypothetical protein
MDHALTARFWRSLPLLAVLFFVMAGAAIAQANQPAEVDPPGRVAHVTQRAGSVVFAPEGEEEWVDLPQNRPLTAGDRLWSDANARAEVHLGSATLHIDSESHVGLSTLDDNAAQFLMMQGSVNARVRDLQPGENFEIGTPNLAFRATQPGDYRIDVDADVKETRVIVHSGMATVFGEGGQSVNLGAGQQATFAGRFLAQVHGPVFQQDQFGQWAAERNRAEDLSAAARHVPRGVVGYPQLDQHGTWGQDATYGDVWYPQVTVQDWAPYRYGRWEHIGPWGWTWIDDAPWGFTPFHYGRWAQIGSRWAWVPGRLAARPVYSPALVVFLGGTGGSFNVGSGPGVGWYPLAPGEAWWPWYRTSPRYVSTINVHLDLNRYHRHYGNHHHRQRHHAVTAVREDDFRHGRSVRTRWQGWTPTQASQAQIGVVPARPDRGWRQTERATQPTRLQAAPPTAVFGGNAVPSRDWGQRWQQRQETRTERREERREERQRTTQVPKQLPLHQAIPQQLPLLRPARDPAAERAQWERDRAVREQHRAQREQERLQHEAVRAQREQQREAQRQRAQQVPQQLPLHQAPPQQLPLQQSAPQWRQQPQQAAPVGRVQERGERGQRGDNDDRRGPRGEGRSERAEDRQWRGPGSWQRGG